MPEPSTPSGSRPAAARRDWAPHVRSRVSSLRLSPAREHEIVEVGIRIALGAQPASVKRMFVYRGIMLSGIGIGIGAAAAGSTQWMSSLLFGVTPVDAATFAAAASVLVIAALVASYVPARRAATVDPVQTLRAQ